MKIERRKPRIAKVGIYGVGHDTYWEQFEGLLDELMGHLDTFEKQVQAHGVETVNFGMIDTAQSAYELLPKIKAANLDVIFCDMLTYATSSTWGVIVRALDIPIVLVALQPLKAMDYSKATTYMQLCNDNICSVPEFTGVAARIHRTIRPLSSNSVYTET